MWLLSIFKASSHQPICHQYQQIQKSGFKVMPPRFPISTCIPTTGDI